MTFREYMLGESFIKGNVKFVVSEHFRDEDGKPLEWELKCIDTSENERILKECLEVDGDYIKLDKQRYIENVMVESIVVPDLGNAELQESYGATSKIELLKEMLYAGEYYRLRNKILKMENKKFDGLI